MKPRLYESTETVFQSNGLGVLSDCISCHVVEERNGQYEAEFEYPVDGIHYADILEGRIILISHDENGDLQPFDIYGHSKTINGVTTFYAHHIAYRQNGITVKPFTASTLTQALQKIKTNSINTNPFNYSTDKSVSASFQLANPKPLRSILGGEEGSLLDVFGTGEYEWDRFQVILHLHRGTDSGVVVRYGKNLISLQDDIDFSDSYNGIVPFWFGQNEPADGEEAVETLVTLAEWVVYKSGSTYDGRNTVIPVDFSSQFQTIPTEAQLRSAAQSYLDRGNPLLPTDTLKFDFVELSQTEEYSYLSLQQVNLCDTVKVIYDDIDTTMKVISVDWDVLNEKYRTLTLGDAPATYAQVITDRLATIAENANEGARLAKLWATNALSIAGNTDQYFWFTGTGTDTGAHITETPKETFLADPTHGGGNLIARSNGIAARNGLVELATFGANGSQIGVSTTSHVTITPTNGMNVFDQDNKIRLNASSTGISIFDYASASSSEPINVAQFGTSARIGAYGSARVEITPTNGMNIFDQNGLIRLNASSTGISVFDYNDGDTTPVNVAQFNKTARIGAAGSSRFMMDTDSLQAYDSNNYKYFEVSANGITYGSKTVANTDEVDAAEDNAKRVATNYLYYDNSVGLKIAQSNPSTATTNYIQIASNGMKTALDADNYSVVTSSGFDIHKGGNSVALFGDTARLGAIANNTSRLYLTSSSMSFIDRDGSGTDLYRLQITNTGMNVFDQGGLLRLNASATGLSVFDYDENDNRVNVAQFSNTARIGIDQKSRVVVNSSGSYFYDDDNNLGTAIMPGTIWIGKTGESSMQISGKTISLLTDGSARMLYVNGENGATQLGNNQEAFVQTYGDTITFKSGNYSAVPLKVYSHGVTSSTVAKTYIQTVTVSNPIEGMGRFYQNAYSFAAPSDIDTISYVSVKIDSGSTTTVTASLNQQTVTIASGQSALAFPLQPPNQSYTVTIYLVYIPKASGADNAVLMADSKVLVDWDGKITAPYLSITGDVATNLKMATGTNIILPTGYSIGTYRDASDESSWMALIYGNAAGGINIGNGQTTNTILHSQLFVPKGSYIMSGASTSASRIVCGISGNTTYMFGYGSRDSSEGASYFDGHAVYMRSNGNISFTAGTSGTISGNKAYTNTSDIRLKTDIESLDTDDIILNLKPFKFHWKDAESYDRDDHYGVSAQDLKELLENKGLGGIVSETNEYLGVAYSELIPMLIHLCQSQQKEIETIKERLQ